MVVPNQLKAWSAHLAKYRKAHPNQSLKEQMKGASKTYKKRGSGATDGKRYDLPNMAPRKGGKKQRGGIVKGDENYLYPFDYRDYFKKKK
jgi:hypothetical protein